MAIDPYSLSLSTCFLQIFSSGFAPVTQGRRSSSCCGLVPNCESVGCNGACRYIPSGCWPKRVFCAVTHFTPRAMQEPAVPEDKRAPYAPYLRKSRGLKTWIFAARDIGQRPRSLFSFLCSLFSGAYPGFHPPAIAPRIRSGSFPDATDSGNALSGDSSDQSVSQTKKRRKARRSPVA